MAEQPDLYPDEQVLWTGSPTRMMVFEPVDRKLMPIHALLLGVFVFLLLNKTIISPAGLQFVVIGIAADSYALVGRLFVRGLAVRGSTYTITNRRLVVQMRVLGWRREYAESLRSLKPPVLKERHDGSGTIRFRAIPVQPWFKASRQIPGLNLPDPQVLHAVPLARQVRYTIAEAQRVAGARTPRRSRTAASTNPRPPTSPWL